MSKKVIFFRESLQTDTTAVGPFTRVRSLMSNQIGFLSVALLADATHIGPLPIVHSHVGVQVELVTENFFAKSTAVGHLTGAHVHMSSWTIVLLTGQAGIKLSSNSHFFCVTCVLTCELQVHM